MADITLSTGQEITFDLNKINRYEYLSLFDKDQPEEEENKILARVSGLTAQEVHDLGLDDWRLFFKAFRDKATRPLDDPNE